MAGGWSMIDLEKITYARHPPKPTIRKDSDGWEMLTWVVTAHPVEIRTSSWDTALKALCDLYRYGVNR